MTVLAPRRRLHPPIRRLHHLRRPEDWSGESWERYPFGSTLFGSRALGTSRATSDIDIGLLADGPLPDELVARLRDAFEESAIPYHVDVIDLARVDAGFRAKVLREGRPWDD